MKYKGIELVEVTGQHFFGKPERMFVWDDCDGIPSESNVLAIIDGREYPVITERSDWQHCAKIPESKPVTYCELSQWLAKGNGKWRKAACMKFVYTNLSYDEAVEDKPVEDAILVRKWKDTEWHKPTREYLGLED